MGGVNSKRFFCKGSTTDNNGQTKKRACLDKAPRLSISIVIWILSSDTDAIGQLNQFNKDSEAAMLSRYVSKDALHWL